MLTMGFVKQESLALAYSPSSIVATKDGEYAGAIQWTLDVDVVRITDFHVRLAFRGQHIGTALFDAFMAFVGDRKWDAGGYTPEGAAFMTRYTGEPVQADAPSYYHEWA